MQNYYQILGLVNFASYNEIKHAFRRLAKLYHPDINPTGQEHFKSILKAYEVLSDTYQKSQYDYKLKLQLNQAYQNAVYSPHQTKRSGEVTEKEQKRRNYYQEHYKKQFQENRYNDTTAPIESNNEFKNILIATPVAVLLIMILLNVWSDKPQIKVIPYKEDVPKSKVEDVVKKKRIVTGDEPYKEYFGGSTLDTMSNRRMKIKNMSGSDLIIFLFNKKEFIRSCYIEHGYEVEITMLPKELSSVRIMQGDEFEYIKELPKAGVYGAFTKNCKFFKYTKKLNLNGNNQITLIHFTDQGFEEIKEDNFFKKKDD